MRCKVCLLGLKVITVAADCTHANAGTERCHEAVTKMPGEYDIVINIQGDEPLMNPHVIDDVVKALQDSPDSVYRCGCMLYNLLAHESRSTLMGSLSEGLECQFRRKLHIPSDEVEGSLPVLHYLGAWRFSNLLCLQRSKAVIVSRSPWHGCVGLCQQTWLTSDGNSPEPSSPLLCLPPGVCTMWLGEVLRFGRVCSAARRARRWHMRTWIHGCASSASWTSSATPCISRGACCRRTRMAKCARTPRPSRTGRTSCTWGSPASTGASSRSTARCRPRLSWCAAFQCPAVLLQTVLLHALAQAPSTSYRFKAQGSSVAFCAEPDSDHEHIVASVNLLIQ